MISHAEYRLASNQGSYLKADTNKIYVGLPVKHSLTDKEVSDFIADSITHEFIHYILEILFPKEVSYLFDAVGDLLRDDLELTKKVFDQFPTPLELWSDFIKMNGFGALVDSYSLNENKVSRILKEGC